MLGCTSPKPAQGPLPEEEAPAVLYDNAREAYLSSCLDAFLFDGDVLPSSYEGESIEWKIEEGHASLSDGIIHKTDGAEEYEPLSLTLTCGDTVISFENLTLLDEAVGYLIAYFTSEGTDKEQLKFAYTFNCEYWFKIHNDRGILKPETGTRRLRDPSIVRKPSGGFALLATQGYDTDSIYVFDTEDFVTFENERVLWLNASSEEMELSGTSAWAPEAFYDPLLERYVIIWSSPEDGGVFCSYSQDLTNNTFPVTMADPGYPVIDMTMVHTLHGWTAILKDEREPMEDYSMILRGTGPSWDRIETFSEPVYQRHQVEGPMIMKSLEKDGWYVFVDDYTRSAYKALYTDDLESGIFEELDDLSLMIPLEKPSHAYALKVTWKEIERITAAYPEP